MKLYTEEEIRKRLNSPMEDEVTIDEFIESLTPIELPSDEEIRKWAEIQSLIEPTGAEEFGRIYGAKWILDKIQGGNK